MIVVLRSGSLRVVIYVDDHEPAHVHVYGDGKAKIDISGTRPKLIEAAMTKGELRKAANLVGVNQAILLQRWREIHA